MHLWPEYPQAADGWSRICTWVIICSPVVSKWRIAFLKIYEWLWGRSKIVVSRLIRHKMEFCSGATEKRIVINECISRVNKTIILIYLSFQISTSDNSASFSGNYGQMFIYNFRHSFFFFNMLSHRQHLSPCEAELTLWGHEKIKSSASNYWLGHTIQNTTHIFTGGLPQHYRPNQVRLTSTVWLLYYQLIYIEKITSCQGTDQMSKYFLPLRKRNLSITLLAALK